MTSSKYDDIRKLQNVYLEITDLVRGQEEDDARNYINNALHLFRYLIENSAYFRVYIGQGQRMLSVQDLLEAHDLIDGHTINTQKDPDLFREIVLSFYELARDPSFMIDYKFRKGYEFKYTEVLLKLKELLE